MQHPAESGRYVKLYNAMLYYIVNLIAFNLLVNNRLKNSIYYCFYIRQYVKDHCHFHIWSFTICSFGSVSESLFRAVRLYDDN